MVVIGIDIGLTGAVSALDHRGVPQVFDLPVINDGPAKKAKVTRGKSKGKTTMKQAKRLCGRGLLDLLRQLVPANEDALVVYEDVRPRPKGNGNAHGNSIQSQGSLMRSRGVVEAVLDVAGFETKAVQPQAWKKHFGLIGEEKGDSREKALELYPDAASRLARVKDHNRAESLLLAAYGLSEFA